MSRKILFLGGGQMAEGIIGGILDNKVFSPEEVFVSDIIDARLSHLKNTYNIVPTKDILKEAKNADVIFLAVRPQDAASACAGLPAAIGTANQTIFISIVAGVDLATIASYVGSDKKIVRMMPNTLIKAQNGFSAACVNDNITEADKAFIQKFLEALGQAMFLNENMYDMFTAYSCVGPMYIYVLMHALIEAGVRTGFSRADAYAITIKNTLGAAQMLEITGGHPLQRVDTMTSPAGVTIDALASLEEDGFVGTVLKSVKASVDKTLSFK